MVSKYSIIPAEQGLTRAIASRVTKRRDVKAPRATLSVRGVTKAGLKNHRFAVVFSDTVGIKTSTLDGRDILVVGPNGFRQLATLVGFKSQRGGKRVVATYQVQAPDDGWDAENNGSYEVQIRNRQVSDASRNFVAPRKLGTFRVNVPPDIAAPTATLITPEIIEGSGVIDFVVRYSDNRAVDIGSLDSADIRVTGPDGFDQAATLVRVDRDSSGKVLNVTYRIAAPAKIWDQATSGTYSVSLQPNQVKDIKGNFIETSPLGTFEVGLEPFRLEAEAMTLDKYEAQEGKGFSSGNQFISLEGATLSSNIIGKASSEFTGVSGVYDLVVGYFDENDGVARIEVRVDGELVDSWELDNNLGLSGVGKQNLVQRKIAGVSLEKGQTIEITGVQVAPGSVGNGENGRIDYIDFVPVENSASSGAGSGIIRGTLKNDTLNGSAASEVFIGSAGSDTIQAGAGTDTVDYSNLKQGIIANLATGKVFKPIAGTKNLPKVMPLGDSITSGNEAPTLGGYRIQLWNRFQTDGLTIDFVGSRSNGPNSLGDKNHEGRGGATIQELTDLVDGGLLKNKPDVILLTIGSNNINSSRPLAETLDAMNDLIDMIHKRSSSTQVLVSSVPPLDPDVKGSRAALATGFNELLSGLVANKALQGRNVSFVDAGNSMTVDDLNADGLHPNIGGYNKLGDAWYDALVKQDTLTGVENITGTTFDDVLIGNAGVNVIEGGKGQDRLTGGGNADAFLYRLPQDGGDTITDFGGDDLFQISASGFGGGLVKGTPVSDSALVNGATPVGTGATFLYSGGVLKFDADGTGAKQAVTLATLTGTPTLSANQFVIVA